MSTAFVFVVILIAGSAILVVLDGPGVHGLVAAYAATTMGVVARSMRPGEIDHLARLFRPIILVAAIPAVWMLIQVIPLPKGLSHPIWVSAAAALNRPILGHISVDPGATVVALIRYLSAMGIVFASTAVAIDRERAEQMLFSLCAITTLMAAILIGDNLGGFNAAGATTGSGARAALSAAAALGVVMAAAATDRAVERYETRRTQPDMTSSKFALVLGLSLAAFALCALAVTLFTSHPIVFATAFGLALFIVIIAVRRLGLGDRTNWSAAAAVTAVLAIAVVVAQSKPSNINITFRFSEQSPVSIESVQRLMGDTNWTGIGAGTFEDLIPIYRDVGATSSVPAPTAAARLATELGWPALWAVAMITLVPVLLLFRGALRRGRDSFHPAAGASCLCITFIEAFCDSSLFETSIVILIATIFGLGLAQSVSRLTQ